MFKTRGKRFRCFPPKTRRRCITRNEQDNNYSRSTLSGSPQRRVPTTKTLVANLRLYIYNTYIHPYIYCGIQIYTNIRTNVYQEHISIKYQDIFGYVRPTLRGTKSKKPDAKAVKIYLTIINCEYDLHEPHNEQIFRIRNYYVNVKLCNLREFPVLLHANHSRSLTAGMVGVSVICLYTTTTKLQNILQVQPTIVVQIYNFKQMAA